MLTNSAVHMRVAVVLINFTYNSRQVELVEIDQSQNRKLLHFSDAVLLTGGTTDKPNLIE